MKKLYIAPNLTCTHIEAQGLICASPSSQKKVWSITGTQNNGRNNMSGTIEDDGTDEETGEILEIYSKRHDAWSTWDE